MGRSLKAFVLSIILAASACGSDDDGVAEPDGSVEQPDGSTGDSDASVGDQVVPSNAAALFPYLQARMYDQLPAESGVHGSTGPHGNVRTFINSTLEDSLIAGNAEHPMGSATVKELYESDGTTLLGWAVMVKTSPTSDSGQGWYWYEVFSTTDGSNPVADGNGVGLCSGCHSGGDDYVLTPYPLQ